MFLAVDTDTRARAAVAATTAALQHALGHRSNVLRWTRPENAHITLHFLGEIAAERTEELRACLGDRLERPRFTASLGALGTFPPRSTPKTVWVSIARGATEVGGLHGDLKARLSAFGIAADPRPFSPHLTLARVRDSERRRAGGIAMLISNVVVPAVEWEIDRVTLYESDLSGPVPRYTVAHQVMLAPLAEPGPPKPLTPPV